MAVVPGSYARWEDLSNYNDDPDTTLQDVLTVFEKAIAHENA
jgi:hypothetical protein